MYVNLNEYANQQRHTVTSHVHTHLGVFLVIQIEYTANDEVFRSFDVRLANAAVNHQLGDVLHPAPLTLERAWAEGWNSLAK